MPGPRRRARVRAARPSARQRGDRPGRPRAARRLPRWSPSSRRKREGLPDPRHEQMPLSAGQPDVEEAPLLCNRLRRLGEARRQFLLLDARDENRLEFEPLRAVERQKVDAAACLPAVAEAPLELGYKAWAVELASSSASLTSRAEVASAARSRVRRACPADPRASRAPRRACAPRRATRVCAARSARFRGRGTTHPGRGSPLRATPPRSRRAGRSCGRGSRASSYGMPSARIRSTTKSASSSHGVQLGLRTVGARRAQRLLCAAELGHEPVREASTCGDER